MGDSATNVDGVQDNVWDWRKDLPMIIIAVFAVIWGYICTQTVPTVNLVKIWFTAVAITITFIGITLAQLPNIKDTKGAKDKDKFHILYDTAYTLQIFVISIAGALFGNLLRHSVEIPNTSTPSDIIHFLQYIPPAAFVFLISISLWDVIKESFIKINSVVAREMDIVQTDQFVSDMRHRREELVNIIGTNLNIKDNKDVNDDRPADRMKSECSDAKELLDRSGFYLVRLFWPFEGLREIIWYKSRNKQELRKWGRRLFRFVCVLAVLIIAGYSCSKFDCKHIDAWFCLYLVTLFIALPSDFFLITTWSKDESDLKRKKRDSVGPTVLNVISVFLAGAMGVQNFILDNQKTYWNMAAFWSTTAFYIITSLAFLIFSLDLKNLTARYQLKQLQKNKVMKDATAAAPAPQTEEPGD